MNSFVFGDFKAEIDVTDVSFVETYEARQKPTTRRSGKCPRTARPANSALYVRGILPRV